MTHNANFHQSGTGSNAVYTQAKIEDGIHHFQDMVENKRVNIYRIRFLYDYVGYGFGKRLLVDLSYCICEKNGKLYQVMGLPFNTHKDYRTVGEFKRDICEQAKKSGIYFANLFSAMSMF